MQILKYCVRFVWKRNLAHLTLGEGYRLRGSEITVLRTFRCNKDEVTARRRRLTALNKKLHNLYSTEYYQGDRIKEDYMCRMCRL
jgi:hypothetical protein